MIKSGVGNMYHIPFLSLLHIKIDEDHKAKITLHICADSKVFKTIPVNKYKRILNMERPLVCFSQALHISM